MRVDNGIAYADTAVLKVVSVRALPGHRLWLRFSTGEEGWYDATPLLGTEAFSPLREATAFADVALDYGVPTWPEYAVDLAPEYLYEQTVGAAR